MFSFAGTVFFTPPGGEVGSECNELPGEGVMSSPFVTGLIP